VQIAVQVVKIDPAQTEVIKYLLDALNDSNDNTRRQAWIAVGLMGPNAKSAENQLYDAYNNEPNKDVKDIADMAYRKVTGQ
jgi:HEAT repeat protein